MKKLIFKIRGVEIEFRIGFHDRIFYNFYCKEIFGGGLVRRTFRIYKVFFLIDIRK